VSKSDIKYVNESPEAKATGVKLVRRSSDRIKSIFAFCFIVLVICAAILTYLAYNNQLNLVNLVCPASPDIEIPSCPANPSCPKAPDCNPQIYLNTTCSPITQVFTNST